MRSALPQSWRRWLRRRLAGWPFGIGARRRLSPVSPFFGLEGRPVDRYYIEQFLQEHAGDIAGRTLEIGDNRYTLRFGGARVTSGDVLHLFAGDPSATIVADLTAANNIPADSFDCIILTQTLQMIYDTRAAIRTLCRILRPGGVLLGTVPGIAPISRYDMEKWGDYWRFTSLSVSRLFGEVFGASNVSVEAYGNLVAATAFLCGLGAEDVPSEELGRRDDDYEMVIAVRATKSL